MQRRSCKTRGKRFHMRTYQKEKNARISKFNTSSCYNLCLLLIDLILTEIYIYFLIKKYRN